MLILRSGSSETLATTVFRQSPEERRDLAIFSVMMVRPSGFVVGLLGLQVLFDLANPTPHLVSHELDLHRREVDPQRFAQRDQRVDFLHLVNVVVGIGEVLRETLEAVLQIGPFSERKNVRLDLT